MSSHPPFDIMTNTGYQFVNNNTFTVVSGSVTSDLFDVSEGPTQVELALSSSSNVNGLFFNNQSFPEQDVYTYGGLAYENLTPVTNTPEPSAPMLLGTSLLTLGPWCVLRLCGGPSSLLMRSFRFFSAKTSS